MIILGGQPDQALAYAAEPVDGDGRRPARLERRVGQAGMPHSGGTSARRGATGLLPRRGRSLATERGHNLFAGLLHRGRYRSAGGRGRRKILTNPSRAPWSQSVNHQQRSPLHRFVDEMVFMAKYVLEIKA